ncbi:uncharacterized protein LOC132786724 [Drosophila nasuta]|uniref:uncharacterized protein LOC132786724 n=1 Tax=Drosophila nasuta TaxID=42062 RepID=UPI00295F0C3D|nr:uncharacterized protein LOC132786724 [Drosophila nasuta]XP_060649325.1 uncharacterized protein LOC132786724 [Drosophila nasuta]XP_060649327.1 uncharacterized protein LOC132786724 [Drosophila nasuta]
MPEPIVNEFHVAPDWLTRDYVEQKLRVYFKDAKLQLTELQVTPGTANGENYASVMTRINVEFKDKDQANQRATFLVNTTFADKDPAAHLLGPYGIYVREMDMYQEVLPKLAAKVIRSLEDDKELHDRYAEKFKGVVEHIMYYGEKTMIPRKGDFVISGRRL